MPPWMISIVMGERQMIRQKSHGTSTRERSVGAFMMSGCVTSRTRQQLYILLLLMTIVSGTSCEHDTTKKLGSLVSITDPVVTLPSKLLSELKSDGDLGGNIIQIKYRLENHSSVNQQAIFYRTDCFCVTASLNGVILKRGEAVQIPARGTVAVDIHWKIPQKPGQQSARAVFQVPVMGGGIEYQRMDATIDIEPDLTIVPSVLAHSFRSSGERTAEKRLAISRVIRSAKADMSDPIIACLPPGVRVAQIASGSSSPEKIGVDLWKMTFDVIFQIELDSWHIAMGGQPIHIAFHDASKRIVSDMAIPVLVKQAFGIEVTTDIHFGVLQPGQSRIRRLALIAADERDFVVRKITSSAPEIIATMATSKPEKRQWIDVQCQLKSASCTGQIKIETDHPDAPIITIAADAFVSN